MNYFSSEFKLGILGGGQLGKMLIAETRKWDIYTSVLDPSTDAPCQFGANSFSVGDLNDYDHVMKLGRSVDVLTIEIENVNLQALQDLEDEGVKVYPSAQTLSRIKNKATQKQYYAQYQIPTADFFIANDLQDLKDKLTKNHYSTPFVWKSAEGGYDGNGVKIIKDIADINQLPNVECIAEKLIPFAMELAVIVARSSKGEIKTYPVVEMEFHPEANQVEYVICPARISDDIAQKARVIALKVSEAFEHVGLLAVEMFLTHDGEILVNEVAPRPHNSGHYSIEAAYTNQFEQHLRAILGLPLGNTDSKTAAVMVNLVGAEGHAGKVVYENMDAILRLDGVTPHIYGKSQTRPFRKMGHVTITNTDMHVTRTIAQQVKETIKVISE